MAKKSSIGLTVAVVGLSTAVLGFGLYTAWKNRRGGLSKDAKLDADMDKQIELIKNAPK